MTFVKGYHKKDGSFVPSHERISNKKFKSNQYNSGCSLFILLLFIIGFFLSCSKNKVKCERWRFYETCRALNAQTNCSNPPTVNYIEGNLCGEQLDGACEGCSKPIRSDVNAIITRHFVKKLD